MEYAIIVRIVLRDLDATGVVPSPNQAANDLARDIRDSEVVLPGLRDSITIVSAVAL